MPPRELGYDELSLVMMLAAGTSIDDKFTLSQVCRSWRDAALTTPSLWSCFAVRTRADALRLPAVIQRASPTMSMPMDITLDFGARKVIQVEGQEAVVPLIDLTDRLGIYQELEPHMPFVQRLCIKFGPMNPNLAADEPLSRLFNFPTPALEQLAIFFSAVFDGPTAAQPMVPLEAASRLRSLALISAIPANWRTVISPTLETLYLRVSGLEPNILVDILSTCPGLTHLTFLPLCSPNFEFATRRFNTKLQRLRVLHLGGPFANIWSTVAPLLCPGVLDSVTATIAKDSPAGTATFVGQNVFPAAWSPVACTASTLHLPFHPMVQRDMRLVDSAGKERRVLTSCPGLPPRYFRDLWRGLVLNTNALDTIATFTFHSMPAEWAEVCDSFRVHPPRHAGFQLCLPLRRRQENALWRLDRLRCPTVQKVTFDMDDHRGLDMRVVLAIVDRIVHQDTIVCAVDAFSKNTDRAGVSDWLVKLEEELSQRTGWALCRHCAASASHDVSSAFDL